MSQLNAPVSTGDVIDQRFVLYEELRRTAYSITFEARRVEPPRDWVIVEVLLSLGPRLTNSGLLRLSSLNNSDSERDFVALRRLNNPYIAPVIEQGTLPTGHIFTARAQLEGQPLFEYLEKNGALGVEGALQVLQRLLDTLNAAHSAGLVHERINPYNLYVMDTVVDQGAHLLNFGIANAIKGTFPAIDNRSPGEWSPLMGPPQYLAPEQLEGSNSRPQTDLYSFGLVLVECITGKPLIKARDPLDIIAHQRSFQPHRLPESLHDSPLAPILQKLLAKRVEERYRRAEDVLVALEHLGEGPDTLDVLESGMLPITGLHTLPGAQAAPIGEESSALYFTPPTPDSKERNGNLFIILGLVLVVGAILLVLLSRDDTTSDTQHANASVQPTTSPPTTRETPDASVVTTALADVPAEATTPPSPDTTVVAAEAADALPNTAEALADDAVTLDAGPVLPPQRETFPVNASLDELDALCADNNLDACVARGLRYHNNNGWGQHRKGSLLFIKGCEEKHIPSCIALADAMVRGRGIEQDRYKAYKLIKDLCEEGGHIEACFEQANMLEIGRGTSVNHSAAGDIYLNLCNERNIPRACVDFARQKQRRKGNSAEDVKEIGELYQKACNQGEGDGCYQLGKMYRDGRGFSSNRDRWIALIQQGCDVQHGSSCTFLAEELEGGEVLEANSKLALETYTKACEYNSPKGCSRLCGMHLYHQKVKGDIDAAFQACEKGCLLGDAKACRRAALLLRDGTGTERDFKRARLYLRLSCEGRDKKACKRLKKMKAESGNDDDEPTKDEPQKPVVKPIKKFD